MASGVRLLCEATNPMKASELCKIEKCVNKWQETLRTLRKEFKEDFSNNTKIAIFTNMLPEYFQDFVYQHVDKEAKYEAVRDKIMTMVNNKLASSGPIPMEIGRVGSELKMRNPEGAEQGHDSGSDCEIDAVNMNNQCYKCWGYGHLARECATRSEWSSPWPIKEHSKGTTQIKGLGKGSYGQQYFNKDQPKGKGKNQLPPKGKAKGKGKNHCWKCNQSGHKAHECQVQEVETEEAEEAEECWEYQRDKENKTKAAR